MTKQDASKLTRGRLDVEVLKHFINGGFGLITVTNTRTDKHVTLRFAEPTRKGQPRDPHAPIFVSNFQGTRGDEHTKSKRAWAYFGCIWRQDRETKKPISPRFWYHSAKAKGGIRFDSACTKTVEWLMDITSGKRTLPDYMQLWHEGTCCFCGRPLTQTESIKRGYGPTCAKQRSLPYGKVTSRGRKACDVPPAKDDASYDERVAELLKAGFDKAFAHEIADGEAMQAKERAEEERRCRDKMERDSQQSVPAQETKNPEAQEVPAEKAEFADDLAGFKWI